MKRLPRKKKKEFKKRDPELYRLTHVCSRVSVAAISCYRSLNGLVVNIKSMGGSVRSGREIQSKLQ